MAWATPRQGGESQCLARYLYNVPMRLRLQQPPEAAEAPRFVQLTLQPDLFGGWTLLRETGQQGQGKTTLRSEQYLHPAQALAALEKVRDAHFKKGFLLVSAHGTDHP